MKTACRLRGWSGYAPGAHLGAGGGAPGAGLASRLFRDRVPRLSAGCGRGAEPIDWKRWWRFRALHRRLGLKFWAFVCRRGQPCRADLETFWTTAGFALIQGYGMTETTALVTLNHPFKIARGSIGKPLSGREVKIGADGEILVRGDSIAVAGVAARPAARATRVPDWLATGDLAARNARGELVFAGRKSDVMVTAAGLNIHPQDLEAVLRRQPGVRDALVVAYASPTGPAPAAVLICRRRRTRACSRRVDER